MSSLVNKLLRIFQNGCIERCLIHRLTCKDEKKITFQPMFYFLFLFFILAFNFMLLGHVTVIDMKVLHKTKSKWEHNKPNRFRGPAHNCVCIVCQKNDYAQTLLTC